MPVEETFIKLEERSPPEPPSRTNYIDNNHSFELSSNRTKLNESQDLPDEDNAPKLCSLTQCICCLFILLAIGTVIYLTTSIFSSDTSTPASISQKGLVLNNTEHCSTGYTWFSETGYCYKAVLPPSSFEEAESTCLSDGAHLTSIHSEIESIFIAGLFHKGYLELRKTGITKKHLLWIGMTRRTNGKWQWIDGSPMDYEAWYYGSANVNESIRYAYISHTGTKWYTGEDDQRSFVCKKPAKAGVKGHSLERVSGNRKCILGYYWFESTSSCYMISTNHTTFEDAHQHCKSDKGDLVSVHSDLENILLNGLIMKRLEDTDMLEEEEMFWIGLKTRNKEYIWTDGSPDDFHDWWPRTPDYTRGKDWVLCTYWKGWQPSVNDSLNGYICEMDGRP